jgi:CysZ protein
VNVLTGIQCFTEGVRQTFSKSVRPFVIMPALISLAIIIGGLYIAFGYIADLATYLSDAIGVWPEVVQWVLKPLLYLLGLLAGAWLFGFIATVVGSPFLGELAMRVDPPPGAPITPWWRQIGPALVRELRKLAYHLPRLLLLVIISVIPVVNIVAPIFWLTFGAWLMAVQFCDYTTENHERPFTDTLATARQHRAASLGFGACVTLAMSVPLLNFLVAPVAVVGGTRLMQRMQGR